MAQTVTLQLPDAMLQRCQRGATAARKLLDEFLVDRLMEALPPSADAVPSPLREELRALELLDDEALCWWPDSTGKSMRSVSFLQRVQGRADLLDGNRKTGEKEACMLRGNIRRVGTVLLSRGMVADSKYCIMFPVPVVLSQQGKDGHGRQS